MENRSEFNPVGTAVDSFPAVRASKPSSKKCSRFILHVKCLSGQKELRAWLLRRNTKEIEFSWRKHLLALILPFHGKKCVLKKWGFPHMVNQELLPFSSLLPFNIQGDSTVMFLLNQLVFNPGWSLCVGVCPSNYILILPTCYNTRFPAFQQPECQTWGFCCFFFFISALVSMCACVFYLSHMQLFGEQTLPTSFHVLPNTLCII